MLSLIVGLLIGVLISAICIKSMGIKINSDETYGFNIVGHTQLDRQLVLDQIADLDCRKAFYIDDQGVLRSYDTDEECVKKVDSDD